jgi:hypothetical protein
MNHRLKLVYVRLSEDSIARLKQVVPALRRKTGAACNFSSVIRQCISICLNKHRDEMIADLKLVAENPAGPERAKAQHGSNEKAQVAKVAA